MGAAPSLVGALALAVSLYLGIETSNPSAWSEGSPTRPGVAAARAGGAGLEVLGAEPIALRPNEDDLMPAIDRLFRQVRLAARDLTHVAVSVGPGGYTAVRLAVTAAKMISEATGAQCLPVPTAGVVARRVEHGQVFAVGLASKGESVYVTLFDAAGFATGPGRLMTAADLPSLGAGLLVVDRFLPEAMRRRVAELGIEVRPPVFDPVACIEAAMAGVAPVDPADLLPLYPREPEAVTKWRQLHPPA
jgi:tRNA threonylcarbamoyladenosine biosynthesis protein TsaB